ncbi:DNA topoisomerase IB [Phytohabitans sp. ZYX-F-186]|uniref:DNA topoisomerase n=1 Tax=Phytohabitans maris TaxID=3071409 RepID=A0ABU0ZB50_9ACTN|nr:DNA topoisomerase IB [Phytohabitans sp. ZYX-F-186]MDQ7904208.1 DNA topoisomerase IB [Phytohabitans sp. ZYX-F-186]
MRLRRSDLTTAGYGRRRRGRGISYVDERGAKITDPETLRRLRELVIPPAWSDVWISPDPLGHIQATGIDAAGRKQYLYHPQWRADRDAEKHEHVLDVAARLPALRRQVNADLGRRGLGRERVLAAIAALLDSGAFRVGGDEYANGDDPTYGVATLRPEHVRGRKGGVVLEFPAKGGVEQACEVTDARVCEVLRALHRRRKGSDRLFGYWDGRGWHDMRSDDVNEYLRAASGTDMTAKDLRTWHATLLAAWSLAGEGPQGSATRRKRAVAAVMREVAELLGNTPAVAKASYVDPRVVDLYHDGRVAAAPSEKAVRDLLS